MSRARPTGPLRFLLAVVLVLPSCAGTVVGGEPAVPQKPESKPPAPQLSPEEQAAQDLLERYKVEAGVKQDQARHLAEQHFKTGKAHFDMGDWKAAHPHFQKAVELCPTHKEAQDYLRKTRSLLGVVEGRPDVIAECIRQRSVGLEMRKLELANVFAEAVALYEKGQYAEALSRFLRARAMAQALAPQLDVAKTAEDTEVYIRKADGALRGTRAREDEERVKRAREEAERLRKGGQSLLDERQRTRLARAEALFGQARYEEARKLCDEILRHDPANGAAIALRENAVQTARSEAIDRVLRTRSYEMSRWMDEVSAQTVPQTDLVHMPRERLDLVRGRREQMVFGAEAGPPEAWESRIRDALENKVSFDFIETPLPDVLNFLGSLANVTIILDTEAVKGAMPQVSLRVQDMRLASALNWICKLVGLRYTLRNEALFVSKPERIYDTTVLRMFDITDLTMEIKNFKGRHTALATGEGWGAEGDPDQGIGLLLRGEEDEDEDKGFKGEELIEFIKRILGPSRLWDEEAAGKVHDMLGLPNEAAARGKGQELVDLIGVVVGGRSYLVVKTKE